MVPDAQHLRLLRFSDLALSLNGMSCVRKILKGIPLNADFYDNDDDQHWESKSGAADFSDHLFSPQQLKPSDGTFLFQHHWRRFNPLDDFDLIPGGC